MSRPILITGAAGFIGSHVAEALIARGISVVGVDNFDAMYATHFKKQNLSDVEQSARHAPELFRFIDADITDANAVNELFTLLQPSGVIHLAARAGVRPSIEDPAGYMKANVLATANILHASGMHNAHGCSRVVCASSSSVYGNCPVAPFHEEMDVSTPISPYAASKRANELQAFTHHHLTGQPVAMLRFFTVYGPRQRPDLAINKFLSRVARGESIEMFGDGHTSRDYTFVNDIVRGVLSAYEAIPTHGYRVWNLGSDRPTTLNDLISAISTTVGKPAQIVHKPMQQGDVERTWADLSRSAKELQYRATTTLADGLAAQYEWMKRS
ncbi:MAG: GDP-mannose 4,6-dehydratase [Planctomycetes bacterium]|nr:GDP-mannose 4,6-dehydratase [Planctomycetota bacterium]